ncbi:mechanosensitive ion channel domain-containing protein [Planctomicrobium sp. SH661]|uniref:mechanosensitive ion channel domain-containing protein n=1 Tax=Planctomicrobium sp. SH661 TaxID=3448124 RepID=UPI003F5BBA79
MFQEMIRNVCASMIPFMLAVMLSSLLSAQETLETPAPSAPTADPAAAQVTVQVTPALLDELKKRVDAATELSDEQKKSILDTIELARTELIQSAEFAASFKTWQQRTEEIAAARLKALANHEAALREKPQPIQTVNSVAELEQLLATKQQDLVNAQNEQAQTEKRIVDRSARQKAIKDRLAALPAELDANATELSKLPASTDMSLAGEAKRLQLLANRMKLENEPTALQAESAFLSAQEAANLLQLARQEWIAKSARLKEEVRLLQLEVLRQKSKDAKDRADVASGDAESAPHPEIKTIYEANVGIVEQEIEFREKEKRLKDQIEDTEAIIKRLTERRKDLETRKGKIGTSKSFGIRLQNEGKLLPDPRKYRDEIASRIQTSQEAQLNLIEVSSQVSDLGLLENKVNQLSRTIFPKGANSELSDAEHNELSQLNFDIRRAYEQQQKYLTELQSANEAYVSALDALDAQQATLVAATESFQKFINENVLWIPTSNVLTFNDIIRDSQSLTQLFGMNAWKDLVKRFLQDAAQYPAAYLAGTLAWMVLLFTQRKQRDMIRALGQKASSRLNTTMQPTWLAIFWTVVKSFVVPFPLLLLGWRGMHFEGTIKVLSHYVYVLSIWLLWLELVRNTCRDRGLGVAHFQWPERVNRIVLVQLSSFIVMATPVIFIVAIMQSRTVDQDALPVERLCSVAYFLLLAYSLHRLTSRKTGILREWIELHPGGWLDRLAGLWDLLAVLLPLFLAGLTIAGYTYASGKLAVRLARTLMVVFGGLFAQATFVRWLTLRQRRMAIDHAREVRAALAESKGNEDGSSAVKLEAQEARTNLVEVSMQSKRLLNTTVIVISLACIWYIWIDVLPALQRLNHYPVPFTTKLTLANVLSAGLIGIIFTTAARNIPGLIEMLLLDRLPLDRSVRYAIGALTRYVIVVMGIMFFCNSVGIDWTNIQWLVAALTFGLGFGLQEIFANFVSGLIILFEQPVRVGDVVTIDSVTGTVSRIRIRSTTIVDWDRKEYIVPNKGFITGRLLNWTLTDTTNRISVRVGVSYNADPVKVRELLQKIARTQPQIMTEPGPSISFEGFGTSSLNFVINAFLPSLESRGETMHQLHVRIVQEFKANGIEIALPQQDLHIRTTVPIPVQELNGQPGKNPPPKPDNEESEFEDTYK